MAAQVVLWSQKLFSSFAVLLALVVPCSAADVMLLEFTSAKCNACQSLRPVIQQLSSEGWIIREIDAYVEANLAQRWQVDRLPTLVVLADGEEVDRIMGEADESQLRSRLARFAPKSVQPESKLKSIPQSSTASSPTSSGPFPALDFGKPNDEPVASPATLPVSAPSLIDSPPLKSRFQEMSAVSATFPTIDMMAATIRIRVDEGSSYAFGTGTIIEQRGEDVLAITCGHLFRSHAGKTPITIEYFENGKLVPTQGAVIDYQCDEVDIALVAFKSSNKLMVAPVRPESQPLTENETAASYGCDHGENPTRRESRITKLNRYLGAPNVEAAGAPVQGRSGGGLFDAQGQLIGVCYAADEELNEGLYSAPQSIYQQLAKYGLNKLYDRPSNHDAAMTLVATDANNVSPTASVQPDVPLEVNSPLVDIRPTAPKPTAVASYNDGFPDTATKINPSKGSLQGPLSIDSSTVTNLTVIVRTSDGQQRIIDIADAPASLVQALQLQSMPDEAPTAVARAGSSMLR
jgi:thiol-disulfide isomerase/thioredoxin